MSVYTQEEMAFGYRTSIVKTKPCVVLSTVLKLQKGDRSEISATMQELSAKRREKQPLEYPSAEAPLSALRAISPEN